MLRLIWPNCSCSLGRAHPEPSHGLSGNRSYNSKGGPEEIPPSNRAKILGRAAPVCEPLKRPVSLSSLETHDQMWRSERRRRRATID